MPQYAGPKLELDDIQGDVLVGLTKNAEAFLFFRIADVGRFKHLVRRHLVHRVTNARRALAEQTTAARERVRGVRKTHAWTGLNLGFTGRGLDRLLGAGRAALDPAFERGAAAAETIAALHDPPLDQWLPAFRSDTIDGVFLLTGPSRQFCEIQANRLLAALDGAAPAAYAETGEVRPGPQRGHEHFGFNDGISQPGIRGLTRPSRSQQPDQGLPGQDLIWPGEFVYGYPGQGPDGSDGPGPVAASPAPWARNGSLMVFRRLEQRVPEFHAYVAAEARRLGMSPELLGGRMVGRWRSGAPLELAPLQDNAVLADDPMHNNDFCYGGDPFQRRCPYAAHIRKTYPRDDAPGGEAETLRHRILRAGIAFGPELMPGEVRTAHSRGLMFVCYQIDIARQFEFIQRRFADNPEFVPGKTRPDTGQPVRPGFDPIIGQAAANGVRHMDEPAPNYPSGNRRSTLTLLQQFVVPTAAAYFFMPSLSALTGRLTAPG